MIRLLLITSLISIHSVILTAQWSNSDLTGQKWQYNGTSHNPDSLCLVNPRIFWCGHALLFEQDSVTLFNVDMGSATTFFMIHYRGSYKLLGDTLVLIFNYCCRCPVSYKLPDISWGDFYNDVTSYKGLISQDTLVESTKPPITWSSIYDLINLDTPLHISLKIEQLDPAFVRLQVLNPLPVNCMEGEYTLNTATGEYVLIPPKEPQVISYCRTK